MEEVALKIGTLSFERHLDQMALPAGERREYIAHVAGTYAPDLLLCAGWSLDNDTDLNELAQDVRVSAGKTTLIVEVRYSAGAREPQTETQRVYLVGRNNLVQPLGRQTIVTSKQLKGECGRSRIALFKKYIDEKSATFQGKKLFALCCGEINVLGGRKAVAARFAAANEALSDADIIVNPTHDLMSNAGTLIAKRRWLSRIVDGRDRVYVSASNWNSLRNNGQKQKPKSKTLHTVYVSEERQGMTCFSGHALRPDDTPRYVYRQCEVAL